MHQTKKFSPAIILFLAITGTAMAASVDTKNCGGAYLYTQGGGGKRSVTSDYGYRTPPQTQNGGHGSSFHQGVDIGLGASNKTGDMNAYSTMSGTVSSVGYMKGYGYTVIIDNGNGVRTLYAHASSITVTEGQSVTAGQAISSYNGATTGNSSGAHIHYTTQVQVNGQWVSVDPAVVEQALASGDCPSNKDFINNVYKQTLTEANGDASKLVSKTQGTNKGPVSACDSNTTNTNSTEE